MSHSGPRTVTPQEHVKLPMRSVHVVPSAEPHGLVAHPSSVSATVTRRDAVATRPAVFLTVYANVYTPSAFVFTVPDTTTVCDKSPSTLSLARMPGSTNVCPAWTTTSLPPIRYSSGAVARVCATHTAKSARQGERRYARSGSRCHPTAQSHNETEGTPRARSPPVSSLTTQSTRCHE